MSHLSSRISLCIAILGAALSLPLSSGWGQVNTPPDGFGILPDEVGVHYGPANSVAITVAGANLLDAAPDGEFVKAATGQVLWALRHTPASSSTPAPGPLDEVDLHRRDSAGQWIYETTLQAPLAAGATSEFGASVVASGNRLFIGAPGAVNSASVAGGVVYVYEFDGTTLTSVQTLELADAVAGDRFGASLAVEGGRLLVGAPGRDKVDGGSTVANAGAVYFHELSGTWSLVRTAWSSQPQAGAQFGFSVGLSGRRFAVGAPFEDGEYVVGSTPTVLSDAGAVYLGRWDEPSGLLAYKNLFSTYAPVQALMSGLTGSHFGWSVAVDDHMRVAVSMPDSSWTSMDNMTGWDSGLVMVMHWNGEMSPDEAFVRTSFSHAELPAGARFGEHVESAAGNVDFGIRTGQRVNNAPVHYYALEAIQAQPGAVVGSVETPRRVGDLVAADAEDVTLNLGIPSTDNPYGPYFEISSGGELRAKSSLATLLDGVYPLELTVADGTNTAVSRLFQVEVTGAVADADRDKMADLWETTHGLDPLVNDAALDFDGDGLNNAGEFLFGSDPGDVDSDNDGTNDLVEFATANGLSPQSLAVGFARATSVTLTWQDNCSFESGFTIEKSEDGGVTWSTCTTLAPNVTITGVRGLKPATSYQFRVVAGSAYGNAPSSVVTGVTTSERPVGLGYWSTMAIKDDGSLWRWGGWNGGHYRPVKFLEPSYKALASGYDHFFALKDDGKLWAWGHNANGQLGLGTTEYQSNAVQIGGLIDVVAVSAGYQHTLALKSDGSVLSWGANGYGQLGHGGSTSVSVPTVVSGLTHVVAVSAGYNHSLALRSDGTVWAWGRNEFGQLGVSSTTDSEVPVEIEGLSDVVKISAGGEHCLVVKADGTVWSWGQGFTGQLGTGNLSDSWVPVQVTEVTGMVDIAAGYRHSVAVKSNGTVWTWGWGDAHPIKNMANSPVSPVQVPGITDAVAVHAGYKHSAIVRPDGELWTWGSNWYDQLGKYGGIQNVRPAVVGLAGVKEVSLGLTSLALKKDGTVMSWGHNNGLGNGEDYPATVPTTVTGLTGVEQVAAGLNHGLALKTDGTVFAWGHNFGGQLGNGTSDFGALPVAVNGLPPIRSISGGEHFSLALANDGHVWSWGYNAQGQLCDGTSTNRLVAVQAQGLSGVAQISAGRQHGLALMNDGTVRAWGWNTYGQLGNNSTTDSSVPVVVQGLSGVVSISAGADHSLALKSDGTVWAWGQNSGGQLGADTVTVANSATPMKIVGLANVIAISSGADSCLALTADGKVWGWGQTQWGQLGFWWTGAFLPMEINGLEGVKKIVAGPSFNAAVREDGTIVSWGLSWFGETGVGLIQMDSTPGPVEGFDFAREAPDVQITSPANGANVLLGQPTTVTATFTAGTGNPQSVSFYHYGVFLGTDNTAPFQYTFDPTTWGEYPISAIGVDSLGVRSARSSEVVLHVPYDSDDDGLPDWWEYQHHGVITYGPSDDVDNDELTEAGEYFYGTLPTLSDSDDDGLGDFEEFVVDHPLVPQSPSVVSVRSGSVTLTWQDTCSYETGFTVQVSADGGSTWSDAVHVAANVTTTGVRGLRPSTAYKFRVLADSDYGVGASASIDQSTVAERSVAAGHWQMHAIKEDGTMWSWGSDWQDSAYRPVKKAGSGYAKAAFTQTHSLSLKNDGTVWSWGYNDRGQLGLGDSANRSEPTLVSSVAGVSAVSTGAQHSVVLRSDGTVWAWGANSFGQLGIGDNLDSKVPREVPGLIDIVAVSAGHTHSLALKSDGTVWAWGHGEFGQLGNSGTTHSNVPVQVEGLPDIVKISAGGEHSMALGKDGSIWTWGKGDAAQLGDGNTNHSSVPLKIEGLQDMVDIAAGSWHSMALASDGHVWGWGWSRAYMFSNQGGTEPFIPRMVNGIVNASAVFAGHEHSAVGMPDGALWTWGGNWYGQLGRYGSLKVTSPAVLLGLNNAKDVSVRFGGLILNRDGSVSSWGQHWTLGNGGQSHVAEPNTVTGLANIKAIASGMNHALAISNSGKVYAWGFNGQGALGNGTTDNSLVPVEVPGLTDVVSVSGGEMFSAAVRSNGTVWTWGYNSVGQLGDNTLVARAVPAAVPGLLAVSKVSAGNMHCLALKQDGTVVSWGGNELGQLGNNSTTGSRVPVVVENLMNVIQVSAGYDHSLALRADGTVWAWGSGGDGRLGNNSTSNELIPVQVQGLSGVVAVAAGLNHSIALKADGSVWGWGNGIGGQLGSTGMNGHLVPAQVADLGRVVKISAGSGFTTAVREDRSVVSFGGTWLANVGNGLMYMNSTPGPVEGFDFAREAPDVQITSPANGANVPLGQPTTVTATFTAGTGNPQSVSFYHYGVFLGTDNTAPFQYTFDPTTWGEYPISAIGVDSLGVRSARSSEVVLHVPYDSDDDGLPDWWEHRHHGVITYGPSDDADNDGLTEAGEYFYGTLPTLSDSDDDGLSDFEEFVVDHPLVPQSPSVVSVRSGSVTLTWQDTCSYETGFTVQVSADGGSTWSDAVQVAANVTTTGVRGLLPSTAYKFRVLADTDYGVGASASIGHSTVAERSVAAGQWQMHAIKEDGTLWSWGSDWQDAKYRPVQIAGSGYAKAAFAQTHSLTLKNDGTVWSWGYNDRGQLGLGDPANRSVPTLVSAMTDVSAVATGAQHSVVLKSDGTVWTWGANSFGQLGVGNYLDSQIPLQVTGLDDIIAVSAGHTHSLALRADGTVWAWGNGEFGRLGNNGTTNSNVAVQVQDLSDIVKISAGGEHSMALGKDGSIWTWGKGDAAQLGDGNTNHSSVPLKIEGLQDMVDIAAGSWHSMALASDGHVWGWGWSRAYVFSNQGGTEPFIPRMVNGIENASAVFAGHEHSAVAMPDGALWAWGGNWYGQLGRYGSLKVSSPAVLLGLNNAKDVSGRFGGLVLNRDGSVSSWGQHWTLGNGGQSHVAIPSTVAGLADIKAIASGMNHALAISNSGKVYAWGFNGQGALGNDTTANSLVPVEVSGLTDVVNVSGGESFSAAVRSNGTVWTWGYNAVGQLGDNTPTARAVPAAVPGLLAVSKVSAGNMHCLALKQDGTVVSWGGNELGQLGNNSTTGSRVPVAVASLTNVVQVSAGYDHSLALRADGTVWAWGSGGDGRLGNNSTSNALIPVQVQGLSGIIAVAAGLNHSIALKADGSVWGWGNGIGGQLGSTGMNGYLVPAQVADLEGVVKISAGSGFTTAVREDRSVVSFGGTWLANVGNGLMYMNSTPGPVEGFSFQHTVPVVQISSPANGANIPLGQPTTITATFTAGVGAPQSVSFYHCGVLLGTDDTVPFQYTFSPSTWGDYPISAIGVDDLGVKSARSTDVVLTVSHSSDFDNDGLPDWWEYAHHGSLTYSGTDDADNDGLDDATEHLLGFNPSSDDSDDDGVPDSESPPPNDPDRDGLMNSQEGALGRNPQWKDHPSVQLEAVGFAAP